MMTLNILDYFIIKKIQEKEWFEDKPSFY